MSSLIKKDVQKVGPNCFLFFQSPDIFYFLSFEIIEIIKVKINLIKMLPTETYVYEAIIPFNSLGTDDPSPQDSIKNVSFLIYNKDFTIKEDLNRFYLFINSKNKASIELLLYNKKNSSNKESIQKTHINNLQNKIQDLLNTISMQEQKINELRQREDNHKNLLNKVDEITSKITNQLKSEENNRNNSQYNNRNNNQYNNSQYNPYNSNNNNPYNTGLNHTRTITNPNMGYNNPLLNNNYNNPNITISTKTIYNPYLPNNVNINNLLTRPENRPPLPVKPIEKKRTINLDNIDNYRP